MLAANRPNTHNEVVAVLSDDDLLDTRAAAAYLGVVPGTLDVWRCTGRHDLEFLKIGRNIRYERGVLRRFRRARARTHT